MTHQRLTIDTDTDSQQLARHLASAAVIASRIVSRAVAADDETLAAWLNSRPPAETMAMFAAHAELGEALNKASAVAIATLEKLGVAADIPVIDVRPVAEKLDGQYRALEFDQATGLFSVARLPEPEPQPEPTPEP